MCVYLCVWEFVCLFVCVCVWEFVCLFACVLLFVVLTVSPIPFDFLIHREPVSLRPPLALYFSFVLPCLSRVLQAVSYSFSSYPLPHLQTNALLNKPLLCSPRHDSDLVLDQNAPHPVLTFLLYISDFSRSLSLVLSLILSHSLSFSLSLSFASPPPPVVYGTKEKGKGNLIPPLKKS